MKTIGIDGCRAGWFCIIIDERHWQFELYPDITTLCTAQHDASRMFIDIPIGLPTSGPRECDTLARQYLKPLRHTSVFPVPCRDAVFAPDYRSACQINLQQLGKSLTKQTWNICSKIAEVDLFLRKNSSWKQRLFESHPEVCFAAFNQQSPMSGTKKSEQGQQQRLRCLDNIDKRCWHIYQQARDAFLKKELQNDDILDAMILAISASQPQQQINFLPEQPQHDDYQLPMRITFTTASAV